MNMGVMLLMSIRDNRFFRLVGNIYRYPRRSNEPLLRSGGNKIYVIWGQLLYG